MRHVVFDERYHALHFGARKINLHSAATPFTPHARNPTVGGADLCLLTSTTISDVLQHLHRHHVPVIEGLCPQIGAKGQMTSVYIHDPDGNLIEIARYEVRSI